MKANHYLNPIISLTLRGALLAIGLLPCVHVASANPIEALVHDCSENCDGTLEEAREIAARLAASSGEDLGYHSVTGVEQRSFKGSYTPPAMPDGQKGSALYGMALFSDDGCDVIINGETVHSRYLKGQALPKLENSFHVLPVFLEAEKEVEVEIRYSNTRYITNGQQPDIDGCTLFLYRANVGIVVDANRDGEMDPASDVTALETPYRFWVNNDQDDEEDVEEVVENADPDHRDNVIATERDLEDFTRMRLIVGSEYEALQSGETKAILKFREDTVSGTPSIQLWPHTEANGGRGYLTDSEVAAVQIQASPVGRVTKAGGVTLPTAFWDGSISPGYSAISEAMPYRNLLFEGSGEGKGELVIEFVKNGKSIGGGGSCWISLMDIRDMYQRVKITPKDPDEIDDPIDFYGEKDNPAVLPPEPDIGWRWDPWNNEFISDPNEEKEYLVFIHGWRMTYQGSQKYGETMFKRLWQTGYKGRFVFVRWPTYSATTHDKTGGLFTYNKSDYRAWKSGKGVADFVNSLPEEYDRILAAHSMGNIVASSALKMGAKVDHYALLNAAVPAMCYDGRNALNVFNYETPDSDDDPITRRLGFRNQLSDNNNSKLTNYYLKEDSALKAWETNNEAFKPAFLRFSTIVYKYDPERNAGERLRVQFALKPSRHLRSFHEAAAYATQSLTKAVGREPNANGSITNSVDMGAKYGFGDNHSAQWRWRLQKANHFYHDLLDGFSLNPNL